MLNLKSSQDIEKIKASGKIISNFFDFISDKIIPGISTKQIDKMAYKFITNNGGLPSFLNYHGFPGTLCTSLNNIIIHGIPSEKVILKEGDVIGLDCGVNLNGYYSDSAYTFAVGKIKPEILQLLETTKKSLYDGIDAIKIDGRISDISNAISKTCAKYGIVENYCGHGVGFQVHEEPEIPNNFVKAKPSPKIKVGMVLAIEPMINLGKKDVKVLSDNWSVATKDGSISAHFEHTVGITENGPEILTL